MATKKKAAKSAEGKPSKTAFVLGFPREVSAAEIVAKAAESGMTLTNQYVHTIRSIAKRAGSNGGPREGREVTSPERSKPRASASVSSVEAQFVDLALDVGLARAEELLAKLRTRLKQLVL